MQRHHLKLREIIWEVTGRCENNCDYCGSKDVWKEEVDEELIKNIAKEIIKYAPEEIDISGGDPLLVSYETHKYLMCLFKAIKMKVKLLINPKSYSKDKKKILNLYDLVGISVNTLEELDIVKEEITPDSNTTIITNFNLHSVFNYEKIESYVKKNDLTWMVQFTIYPKGQESLALYKNESAVNLLFDKINESMNNGIKILLSDNMNSTPCSAGMNSVGILHDGTVIPCLSMRSWVNQEDLSIQGNIIEMSLKKIWERGFYNNRFRDFECCKDICQKQFVRYEPCANPNAILEEMSGDDFTISDEDWDKLKQMPGYTPYPHPQTVMMYAVQTFPAGSVSGTQIDLNGNPVTYTISNNADQLGASQDTKKNYAAYRAQHFYPNYKGNFNELMKDLLEGKKVDGDNI